MGEFVVDLAENGNEPNPNDEIVVELLSEEVQGDNTVDTTSTHIMNDSLGIDPYESVTATVTDGNVKSKGKNKK